MSVFLTMNHHRLFSLILLVTTMACMACAPQGEKAPLKLWYDEPAATWTEALPIGNGRIGAMVYGAIASEHIQFNEETLWTGKPRNYNRPGAADYLEEIRALLFAGKQQEAEELAGEVFLGMQSNEEAYAQQLNEWKAKIGGVELAQPEYDDSDWGTMPVGQPAGWEGLGFPGLDGSVWLRFTFDLPEKWLGKDLIVNLGRVRNEDITYFNGRQVGTESNPYAHRRYQVQASAVTAGKNVIAVHVVNGYGTGGLVGFKTGEPMVVYPRGGNIKNGINIGSPWKYYLQDTSPPAVPRYMAAYQPFGDLRLDFEGHDGVVSNYRRTLNVSKAISTVSYEMDGVRYTREYFVSEPDQALLARITSSLPGSLNFTLRLDALHRQWSQAVVDGRTLELQVQVSNGVLKGVARCIVYVAEGEVKATSAGLQIRNAKEVTIALGAATNYVNDADVSGNPEKAVAKDLSEIDLSDYDALKRRHVAEYQQYFDRLSIDLGGDQTDTLTTDQRIVNFQETQDPALVALYVQYGRYLLISSSRPGTRPANLQGIWNDDLTPPWDSKYTTNINAEMNYWPAEPLNLTEMHEPLFVLMEELAVKGRETAKEHYRMDGWVLHHNTDLWRGTAPINHANHGIWPTGGAWLCHHLWQHFVYTRDTAFLREQAYPLIKGAASFFVQYLVQDQRSKYLISGPSNSPELGGLVMGPTMDHQIIRDLFENGILASNILQQDTAFADTLSHLVKRIAPNTIGRLGQLQEWLTDQDSPDNRHRHISHLWGVYPDDQINVNTPEMMEAAKQSLLFRGDDGTGWSLAWKINLWARFRDGNHAWKMVENLFRPAWKSEKGGGGSYKNLFDAHPPFQIDGNLGAAAGVAELLVQTLDGEVLLLPALPDALPDGAVSGLRIPGGAEIGFRWKDKRLTELTLINSQSEINFQYEDQRFRMISGEVMFF